MLLDMCKSNSMLILNGRCGDGKYNQKPTVIDYSIASFQSLHIIKTFSVLELNVVLSDVSNGHALISTTHSLCFKNDSKVKKSVHKSTKTPKTQAS